MGRRIIALVAAVVLALAGAALVLLYARSADDRALQGHQPETVYVTEKLISSGTTLKDAERSGLLKRTQLAAKAKPSGALTTIDGDNSGLVALADIAPGQVVLARAFGTERIGQRAVNVPAGKIAISVSLEDPNRVGAFVTPGSNITIYDTYVLEKLGTDEATKQYNELEIQGTSVLLTKVPVIGIGATSLSGSAERAIDSENAAQTTTRTPIQTYLVTVAVTPADSLKLVHAIQHGEGQNNPAKHLYFGLEGADTTVSPNSSTDDFRYHGTQ